MTDVPITPRPPLWLLCFVLTVGIVLQINISHAARFEITGVQGEVLENIQARLSELYQDQSITNEPPQALKSQIKNAMYPFGYFRPTIQLRLSGNKALIHINQGPQMRITHLTVRLTGEGADNPDIKRAIHDIPLKVGEPLLTRQYEEAKEMLENSAEHEGYLQASFETAELLIDRKHYTAAITLVFNTGPQYYFGQIHFDPTYISPELLHRFVPFKPGQAYSTDEVMALESNLSASGYFKSIVVRPDINSKRDVPIQVHLERVHRLNYALGVGYGTDTGPRGRATLHMVPVNRAGHKFNAMAQGSLLQNALLAQYLIPGKNPITDTYSFTGSLSNLNYNSGYANSALLSIAHQHIKKFHQRILSLNGLSERFNYTDEPKTSKSLFFPRAALSWSKTSDPLFSPSGYNLSLNGLGAARVLLSDINLLQGSVDGKAAVTLDFIRTRFFFHTLQGAVNINDINNLPLSLALLLGGPETLRGYSYNAVGPGKILNFGGIEIQKETVDKWYLLLFADAGDVYKPTPKDFKYDAGAGLMWVSPVGPIKVGLAQAVDNRFNRIQGKNPRIVINLGPDL